MATDLKFTKDHEWLRVETGNIAVVGITDYAQSQLGDIVYVDIPTVGENLNAGDTFGAIEAVKTVADLFLPVGGKVLELNSELDGAPQLVNQSPYEQGWIVKLEMSHPQETAQLLNEADYKKLIGE
ncbi:glycine cleavage system protein GcvH [Bacteroidia bacterium]|nr:glycine cleavage system protein GcvH [Bacteroidia bacterium]